MGRNYKFYTADVFTNQLFGGNPLAVLPEAEGLNDLQMQAIAREFNLSETVFIFAPQNRAHCRQLRIFTPAKELPFAGHPTVGAAFVLASIKALEIPQDANEHRIIFEEGVGDVAVNIKMRANKPESAELSAAAMPSYGPQPPSRESLAAVLSLSPEDLRDDAYKPLAVSCGVPFLFVGLQDGDAIKRARINLPIWETQLANYWAPSVFCFNFSTETENGDLHARMFPPDMQIREDPATGSAVTALAGYLTRVEEIRSGEPQWTVEQGFEMQRPSILQLRATVAESQCTEIHVAGAAVMVSEGNFSI